MSRYNKEEIDRYFDYGIFVKERILFLEPIHYDSDDEDYTNNSMLSRFVKGLTFLEKISREPITIQMNNPGGDWYSGMGIYNKIQCSNCYITIIVYGCAMSMGSIILQAGDNRLVSEDATLMIHDGEESISGITKTVEAWAKHATKARQRIYEIYLKGMKTKKPRMTLKKIEDMCAHDCIISASEAVSLGLADKIVYPFNKSDQ